MKLVLHKPRGIRHRRIPPLSLWLAYLAMLPIAAASLLALYMDRESLPPLIRLDSLWCGGLLCFFAGVRRGLSFRQQGGPRMAQLAGMMWLFLLGIGTLVSAGGPIALLIALLGFASMIPLDASAARDAEAPRYFARLRRMQMWVPVVSLSLMIAKMAA
jgi:hypothetical protein